jgi:GT2 family glycosyltransferase
VSVVSLPGSEPARPQARGPIPLRELELSIVVVTHNSAHELEGFAAAIPAAVDGALRSEVVVVDSGSTDDTLEVARHIFGASQVVDLGWNGGYAAGINRGIAATSLRGPVIVLNPDTRPAPGSLTLLGITVGVSGVGISVPRLLDADANTLHSLRRSPTIARAFGEAFVGGHRAGLYDVIGEVVHNPEAYERPGTFDWATGAIMCISRECVDAVGPWDEAFFLYSEETDYALRARDAGFVLRYVPDAHVSHSGGDHPNSPALFTLLTMNRVWSYGRRHGRLATTVFWLAVFLHVSIRAAAGSTLHRGAMPGFLMSQRRVVQAARYRTRR